MGWGGPNQSLHFHSHSNYVTAVNRNKWQQPVMPDMRRFQWQPMKWANPS